MSYNNQRQTIFEEPRREDNRRSFFFRSSSLISSGIATAFSSNTANAAQLPPIDTKAPDFSLFSSKGIQTTLSDLTKDGKWTVLYFYPGAFTSGCTLEARGFQKDIQKYASLNTQIVGVSVDAVEKNKSFCESESLDFFMLSDDKGSVSKLYGTALSIPGFGTFSNRQTYIIDPNGNIKWVFVDVESKVVRHSTEVLDKLAELQKV